MNGTRNPRSDARVEVGVSAETQTMPLAIVGMACRFAGGISSPEKLWDLVSQGRDAWSTIPETRFNQPSFYDEQRDKTGTTHIRGGYFLDEDVGLFDPSFFNFSAEVAAVSNNVCQRVVPDLPDYMYRGLRRIVGHGSTGSHATGVDV